MTEGTRRQAVLGAERGGEDRIFGLALSLGQASAQAAHGSGRMDAEAQQFGVHGTLRQGETVVRGALSIGRMPVTTYRSIAALGADGVTAAYVARLVGLRAEIGRPFEHAGWVLTPLAALQATIVSHAGFTERSATPGAALSVAAGRDTFLRTEVGLRATVDAGPGQLWGQVALFKDSGGGAGMPAALVDLPAIRFSTPGPGDGGFGLSFRVGGETTLASGLTLWRDDHRRRDARTAGLGRRGQPELAVLRSGGLR